MNSLKLAQLLGLPCDFHGRRYYEAQHGPHRADTSWGTMDRDEFEAIMETIAEQHRCAREGEARQRQRTPPWRMPTTGDYWHQKSPEIYQ